MNRVRRLTLVALVALVGCGVEAETTVEAASEVGVRGARDLGVNIGKVVQLGGGRDQEHVLPISTTVSGGEWVEFVTLDRRVHTLSFVSDSLSSEALAYLEETGQMRGPPLLERGARFLVDFSEAPEGRYVFLSRSHGDPVFGSITVRGESADR